MKHEKIGLITYNESSIDQIEDVDEAAAKRVFLICNDTNDTVLQGVVAIAVYWS